MQLAVIHYHFDQGGVTQVVKNHLHSLSTLDTENPVERALLLHGGRASGLEAGPIGQIPVEQQAVEGLEYDERPVVDEPLAARLDEALREHGLAPDEDVVHIHNHTLGKNVSLTAAVAGLATLGWRLLLQIHDFAEDYRPANYWRLTEAFSRIPAAAYPTARHIEYAALTGRDAAALSEAGIEAVVLPNPVAAPPQAADRAAARRRVSGQAPLGPYERLLVYPVRGIRRKNIGEAALWAAAAGGRARVLQTMPPANPSELPAYRAWQRLAQRIDLPLQLGSGDSSFADVIAASDAMLTTSVAEGFGMVFLEPWLAGRPLFGRNLPGITADLTAAGVVFDGLYDRLPIPLKWFGEDRFREDLTGAYRRATRDLGEMVDLAAAARQLDELTADGQVDFALLSPAVQAEVVERVARNPELLPAEAQAAIEPAMFADKSPVQASNAEAVAAAFSPRNLGAQLAALLRDLAARAPSDLALAPRCEALLTRFLQIRRLQPCRLPWDAWESADDV